jgi:hypothetical protein
VCVCVGGGGVGGVVLGTCVIKVRKCCQQRILGCKENAKYSVEFVQC